VKTVSCVSVLFDLECLDAGRILEVFRLFDESLGVVSSAAECFDANGDVVKVDGEVDSVLMECPEAGSMYWASSHPVHVFVRVFDHVASPERLLRLMSIRHAETWPCYGYAWSSDWKSRPEWFARGVSFSSIWSSLLPMNKRRDELVRWRKELSHYRSYLKGGMRDVFGENLITDRHLEREYAGRSLRRWIESDRRWGKLEPEAKCGLYIWLIDDRFLRELRSVCGYR
jgi:hypothetical protein